MMKIKALSSCILLASSVAISSLAQAGQVGFADGAGEDRKWPELVNRNVAKATSNFADDFSSGSINRSNYNRSETIREIDTSKGMLHVFTGAYNTTAGVNYTRTNNWINGSDLHTSIEADVIVTEIERGSANHPAFAHIGGTFYSNSATVDGRLGHVFAQIKLGKKGDGFQAWGSIGTSADSTFFKELVEPPVEIVGSGDIQIGDTVTLKLEYHGDNEFTFSAIVNGNEFSETISDAPKYRAAASGMKRIGTGIDWDDTGGVVDDSVATVDALFDNVKTSGSALNIDTFNGNFINGDIWKNDNRSDAITEIRTVESVDGNDAVRLETQGNGDKTDIDLDIRDETDFLEADLMLSSESNLPSGMRGLVRLQGQWYNDTFSSDYDDNKGDVYAQVIIDRTVSGNLIAKAYAERINNSTGSSITTILDNEQFGKNIDFDTFYKASIEFTGNELLFTFDGEVITMPIDTAIYKSFLRTKRIRARVDKGAGKVVAFVDNIRSSKGAKLPVVTDPTDPNGETPTGTGEDSGSGGGAPYGLLLVLAGYLTIRRR